MAREPQAVMHQIDRKKALLFGMIMLLIMLIVTFVSGYLFLTLERNEEDRLARTIGTILSESINRISFSGKYHSRLLLEDLKKKLPELAYISIETPEGIIEAHTDNTKNDTQVSEEEKERSRETIRQDNTILTEKKTFDTAVKEVLLPYRAGLDQHPSGVVRIGIKVGETRSTQRNNLLIHLLLVIVLTTAAVWIMERLSRYFSRRLTASEKALRETNELFTLFMRHSPIFTYIKEVTSKESRVLQASDNFDQMIGISGRDMLGKTMEELFPADFAAAITADDIRVVSQGEILRQEEELNGRYYTTFKFPLVQGEKTLLAGYTIDNTERKLAEKALEEKSEELERYFALSLDLLCIADTNGKFLHLNLEWEKVLGYSIGELVGRSYLDFVHPDDREATLEAVSRLESQRPVLSFENRYRCKDGAYRWIEWRSRPQGNLIYAAARDVTDHKRETAEREKLLEQLAQSQKIESVGRLAGGVAHDFNNMLGVILGHTELAMNKIDPAQSLFANLQEIQKAAERSAALTRQLLAFARRQTVAPKVLDLNETVEGMLKMLRRLIGEDIDLTWRPGRNLGAVKMDPSQIDQIMANLCVNARDACKDRGKISIETDSAVFDAAYCAAHPDSIPGEYVVLSVSDNGSGMDPATISRLFEPFFTTKEVGKGTGLGLATVYGIVKQNSGFINVDSKPGYGTAFKIFLPRHTVVEPQTPAIEREKQSGIGHETILLVEDEPMILNITKDMIEKQGYTVLAASTPGEALRLAHAHADELHLLMTDVVMPEMNGRDLARKLSSSFPGLKCLFMSGYTSDVIAHHGVLEEGVHFIQKPFNIDDLAQKIRHVLDQNPRP